MADDGVFSALRKTRETALGRVANLVGVTELNDSFWEDLEISLIQADVGVLTTHEFVSELKTQASSSGWTQSEQVWDALRSHLIRALSRFEPISNSVLPEVIMLVGVNGSGKTTAAAKLAHRYLSSNRSVLMAEADTFRAAAAEQLSLWGERMSIDVINGEQKSDPGAVVYNAAQAALARGVEALIVDTSGRMHTSHNLMQELQKGVRVAARVIEHAPSQIYLVLDATTGQNALSQARGFAESVDITGIIITKLDTSAKGGIAIAAVAELERPIVYLGVGENIEDLLRFEAAEFVDALLDLRLDSVSHGL